MQTVISTHQKGDYILVPKEEYKSTCYQLKEMFEISHRLFVTYYGKDYYLPRPISRSETNILIYQYFASKLIEELEKRKRNIFYKLWEKIKSLMKW